MYWIEDWGDVWNSIHSLSLVSKHLCNDRADLWKWQFQFFFFFFSLGDYSLAYYLFGVIQMYSDERKRGKVMAGKLFSQCLNLDVPILFIG